MKEVLLMPRQNMEEQIEYWSNIINIREDECKKKHQIESIILQMKNKINEECSNE